MFLTLKSLTGFLAAAAVGMLAAAGAVGCASVKPVPPTVPPVEPSEPAAPATLPQSLPPAPPAQDNARPAAQTAPARPPAVAPSTKAPLPGPMPPSPSPPPPVETAPPVRIAPPAAPAPLDLTSLETRLRETKAIGVLTKLSLKRQVDDLLAQFSAYHARQSALPLTDLRRSFDLLLLKVLSLLQDSDPVLARDVNASRAALWSILVDPQKFRSAHLMAGVMP